MIRLLILAGLLCLAAGCGGSREYAEPVQPDEAEKIVVTFSQGDDPDNLQEVSRTEIDLKTGERRELQTQTALEYVSALPKGPFKATEFPRIEISGVKLWHDPHLPGWEESGGGYRTVQFDCPVAWMDLGDGRELCDASDFRDETYEPKIGDPANIDGDIQIRHREGVMQIMDGGKWREVERDDKLRQSFVDQCVTRKPIYKEGSIERIGRSEKFAELRSDGWYICATKTANGPIGEQWTEPVGFQERIRNGAQVPGVSTNSALYPRERNRPSLVTTPYGPEGFVQEEPTAERRKKDPPPKLGGYSPDENGTAAYFRDLDAWEKRNPAR